VNNCSLNRGLFPTYFVVIQIFICFLNRRIIAARQRDSVRMTAKGQEAVGWK